MIDGEPKNSVVNKAGKVVQPDLAALALDDDPDLVDQAIADARAHLEETGVVVEEDDEGGIKTVGVKGDIDREEAEDAEEAAAKELESTDDGAKVSIQDILAAFSDIKGGSKKDFGSGKGVRKSHTIAAKRLGKVVNADSIVVTEDLDAMRPKTREDCKNSERPCPWVGCRHNLYLDINPSTGSIKMNFPDAEPGDLIYSCILDIVDVYAEGVCLEDVASMMNLTRERVRQIEAAAGARVRSSMMAQEYKRNFIRDDSRPVVDRWAAVSFN